MQDAPRATRRRHDSELKRQVLDECSRPGASVASIALSHGLNANLVHRWRRLAPGHLPVASAKIATPSFVPLPIERPTQPEIRVELQRGKLSVVVNWPASAVGECAAWMREILR